VHVLLNAAVLSLVSAKDESSPLCMIGSEITSLHQAEFSMNRHWPFAIFCACSNVDRCKTYPATEQLFITFEGYWLCLLDYIASSKRD